MIKNILLDLGNVFVTFDERKDVISNIIRSVGGDEKTAASAIFNSGSGEAIYKDIDTGRITFEELWKKILREGQINEKNLPFPVFSALYTGHLKPIPEVVSLATKLAHNYQLVAVSNGDFGSRYVVDMLRTQFGFTFARTFISSEVGVAKPALIEYTISATGYKTPECVFVDDVDTYVRAADALGINAVQFNGSREPVTDLVEKLKSVGVNI